MYEQDMHEQFLADYFWKPLRLLCYKFSKLTVTARGPSRVIWQLAAYLLVR